MGKIVLAVATLLLVVGCTTAPVLNIRNAKFSTLLNGQQPSVEKVERAIMVAAQKRGWSARVVHPGLIDASIIVRDHRASIEIPYDSVEYSILYVDSSNLDYDGTKIHRNYNNWIVKLSESIQKEIYLLQ